MAYQHGDSRFHFDEKGQENAKIKVIGVGGGGGNAINNMIRKGLSSVEYIALNTDAQALKSNEADLTIQVGANLTSGLGAGARPEIGREAVEENRHELDEAVDSADMIFITAGMGGGTGTGGAPVVAGIAKRKGILTVGVVTTPFACEGKVRMKYAMEGINELKKNCDTVIVIPNERLLDISNENTTLMEAFEMANEVLYNATRGISDLILMPGLINLDFADVKTTMIDGGAAIMGSATSTGPDRAEVAAREAIQSPLLDGVSIRGARNVLVNISAGNNLGMRETTIATSIIQQEAGDDAEIILGTVLDETFDDELRVTVISTGFDIKDERSKPKLSAAGPRKAQDRTYMSGLPSSNQVSAAASPIGDVYYKGETNLKNMDSPAYMRRGVHPINKTEENDAGEPTGTHAQQPLRRDGTGHSGFSAGGERIDKRNTEQPAFLRRIMD